jgi:hypothetical protein
MNRRVASKNGFGRTPACRACHYPITAHASWCGQRPSALSALSTAIRPAEGMSCSLCGYQQHTPECASAPRTLKPVARVVETRPFHQVEFIQRLYDRVRPHFPYALGMWLETDTCVPWRIACKLQAGFHRVLWTADVRTLVTLGMDGALDYAERDILQEFDLYKEICS